MYYCFFLALFLPSSEGKPTTEPTRKAINTQATHCGANNPCHVEEIDGNLTLSVDVGESPTLPGSDGICLKPCLTNQKYACRKMYSSSTDCVVDSSTAALCYNNTLDMSYKKNINGTYTIFATGTKELMVKLSPVSFTLHMLGIHPDRQCVYNGPTSEVNMSNQTYLTQKPTSKLAPAGTAPTNFTMTSSPKPDPEVSAGMSPTNLTVTPSSNADADAFTAPTNLTVAPSSKADPDAGAVPTNLTVTPSSKPGPQGGKREVVWIFILVGILAAAVFILLSLFAYLYKKRSRRRQTLMISYMYNPSYSNTCDEKGKTTEAKFH